MPVKLAARLNRAMFDGSRSGRLPLNGSVRVPGRRFSGGEAGVPEHDSWHKSRIALAEMEKPIQRPSLSLAGSP